MFEDRTERLEKKVRLMEEKMDNISAAMNTLTHVISELVEEGKKIKGEKNTLVRANKRLLALVPEETNKIQKNVFRKYVMPFVKENTELVKMTANKNVSLLFDEIVDNGQVDVKKMSKQMNVHEAQIEEWGAFLENNGLAIVNYKNDRAVSIKKSF
jgi:hypothetical protein